jgi:hypothetical protein
VSVFIETLLHIFHSVPDLTRICTKKDPFENLKRNRVFKNLALKSAQHNDIHNWVN